MRGLKHENLPVVSEDDNTDVVGLKVESHSLDSRIELHHLSGLDLGESEHSGNTISDRDDTSEFFQVILHKASVSIFGVSAP